MTLLRSLVCAVALLPLPSIAKDIGPFKPGDTFTLTVKKVESTKQTGYFGAETKAPLPANVPKLKKGQKIRFTIGKKGQLLAKKIKADYAHSDNKRVEYNSFDDSKPNITFTVNCELDLKNKKPTGGTLSFFHSNFTGADPKFRTVRVTLK